MAAHMAQTKCFVPFFGHAILAKELVAAHERKMSGNNGPLLPLFYIPIFLSTLRPVQITLKSDAY